MQIVVREMESIDCIYSKRENVGDDPVPLRTFEELKEECIGDFSVACFFKNLKDEFK